MATPQIRDGMNLTQQQQQQFLIERQQILAQQGYLNQSQLTPQQFAQVQANMHAQQQNFRITNHQAYQAQLMRAQLQQMQMALQRQHQPQNQQQPQPQQAQMSQASPPMNPQQQQQTLQPQQQRIANPQAYQARNMDRQTVSLTRQIKSPGLCIKRTISEDCTGISESEQPAAKFQCLRKEARRHSRQPHLSVLTKSDAYRHRALERAPAPARKHLDENQGTPESNTTPPVQPQSERFQPQQGQMLQSSPQIHTPEKRRFMAAVQAHHG
ncbi:hypothetical protein BJX99DRAFT_148526 [Aspergillus californicus]